MKVANRIEKVSGIICWVVLPALIFLHSKTAFHWLHDDKESCGSLLTTGSFSRISNKWRPSLCSLHWYTKPEVITCAKKRAIRANRTEYIAFLGDSRIRDSFYAFIDIFDYRQYHPVASFEDMQFDVPGQDIVIQFMWRPYLIDFPDTHFYHLTPDGQGLVTLVHGAAAWYLMTFWDMKGAELIAYRRQLKVSLDKISEELPHTQIIWKFQVQTSYQDKPPWSHVNITDKVFEEFNRVSQDLIVSENYDNMWIWSSHRHVAESLKTSGGRVFRDYLHPGNLQYEYDSQILLNFHCNSIMQFSDGSCCRKLWVHEFPGFILESLINDWISLIASVWTLIWNIYKFAKKYHLIQEK